MSAKDTDGPVMRKLRKARRETPLGASWFAIDAALALVPFLAQDEHDVDASAVAILTYLMTTGRSEEALCALKGVIRRKGRETLVPMDGAYIMN